MSDQYTHIVDLAKEATPPQQGILSHTVFQNDSVKAVVAESSERGRLCERYVFRCQQRNVRGEFGDSIAPVVVGHCAVTDVQLIQFRAPSTESG